ncbi:MAG TPA: BspA family leucine-rich repeat surface protein [Candidatus Scybalocola faecigallinarum]|uniref:BspA family leucine-rich repeat surface protein n=1 Tax=Candidatus Scybalocola faecigallinarum TaxID=2840941 RepID=A0A9D1F3I4_9FIRM|nr:BspA family leucine-rich repeat surface protein [Candidatus Scybalocola faecigallinarum]
MYRPVVQDLAILHASGQIHGNISPEAVDVRSRIRFCFPLTEEAAKGYDTNQEIFVHLLPPNKKENSSEHDGSIRDIHIRRSPAYIPLEQLIDAKKIDARSDVYSLCAVLYYLITKTEPLEVQERISGAELKKPSEMGIEISSSQEAALLKGLEEMGKNRYANGGELYRALYGVAYGEKKEKGIHREKRNPDSQKTERKKNFLRSGWTVKDDVKEIEKLRSVTFLDHIPQTKEEKWDVSQEEDGSVMAWLDETDGEYDLYIGSDSVIVAGKNCSWMFQNCSNLKSITFDENFDTSEVMDMSYMFFGCSALEELDVRSFDTSHVTSMNYMFANCSRLSRLKVSGFDTSRVTRMSGMFSGCSRLTKLNVSNFDTSQVTDMSFMFYNCSNLSRLDIEGFDTSRVKKMRSMFYGCNAVLNVSGFDTSKVTDVSPMFSNCAINGAIPGSNRHSLRNAFYSEDYRRKYDIRKR